MLKRFVIKAARRLKSRRGETLVETLIAALIAILSLAALAATSAMAVKINYDASRKLDAYYEANYDLTTGGTTIGSGTVVLTEDGSERYFDASQTEIEVDYYQNTEAREPVTAYRAAD